MKNKYTHYFLRRVVKYYTIGMLSGIIILAVIMGSLLFKKHHEKSQQISRINSFITNYYSLDTSKPHNKFYDDGGEIATYANHPTLCINSMVEWAHRLDKEDVELSELKRINEDFYKGCE